MATGSQWSHEHLSASATTEKKKKKRIKKRALIKARISDCVSCAPTNARRISKSLHRPSKRGGGGECVPNTGSPRKIFALARWMRYETLWRRMRRLREMADQQYLVMFGSMKKIILHHKFVRIAKIIQIQLNLKNLTNFRSRAFGAQLRRACRKACLDLRYRLRRTTKETHVCLSPSQKNKITHTLAPVTNSHD